MKVETFVLVKKDFVSINDVSHQTHIHDRNYVLGMLIFYDDDNQAMAHKAVYDDVNWVWEWIIKALYDFIVCHHQVASFSYPNQSIWFQFKASYANFVNLKIYSDSEVYFNGHFDKHHLVMALLQGAEDFFKFYPYANDLTKIISEIKSQSSDY